MRNKFSETLTNIAEEDQRIILLVGDIGFNVFDSFIDKFPDRFINAGVAEANMISTAAGLAMSGFKPIVYTIIPFLIMRTFEQIRVDLCMHNLPVMLVGVGGGLSYDTLGPTHHAIEDIAIMRALPNMKVISPCDPNEVEWAFKKSIKKSGPTYFRLGKGGEENLIDQNTSKVKVFDDSTLIEKGRDVLICSTGYILKEVLEATKILNEKNISCTIIHSHMLKPFNDKKITNELNGKKLVVTVEEHNIIGGLGDIISSVMTETGNTPPLLKLGINDSFVSEIGNRAYQLELNNINAKSISEKILKKLEI